MSTLFGIERRPLLLPRAAWPAVQRSERRDLLTAPDAEEIQEALDRLRPAEGSLRGILLQVLFWTLGSAAWAFVAFVAGGALTGMLAMPNDKALAEIGALLIGLLVLVALCILGSVLLLASDRRLATALAWWYARMWEDGTVHRFVLRTRRPDQYFLELSPQQIPRYLFSRGTLGLLFPVGLWFGLLIAVISIFLPGGYGTLLAAALIPPMLAGLVLRHAMAKSLRVVTKAADETADPDYAATLGRALGAGSGVRLLQDRFAPGIWLPRGATVPRLDLLNLGVPVERYGAQETEDETSPSSPPPG